MLNECLIFVGAGLGGLSRFGMTNLFYYLLGRQFPYGTLIVNVTGCFLMGLLFFTILEKREALAPALRSFLLIGFLGGYTTFSSFSIETLYLVKNGAWMSGLLNVLLSVSLCLIAVWIGAAIALQFN